MNNNNSNETTTTSNECDEEEKHQDPTEVINYSMVDNRHPQGRPRALLLHETGVLKQEVNSDTLVDTAK